MIGVGLGAIIASAISGGVGLLNLRSQRQTQQTTWDREDSAVQRRTQDLRMAGLSPTLAAGSAATTAQTQAPQMTTDPGEKYMQARAMGMGFRQAEAQIDKTRAEADAINAQKDKTLQDMQFMGDLHPGTLLTQKLKNIVTQLSAPGQIESIRRNNQVLGVKKANIEADSRLKEAGMNLQKANKAIAEKRHEIMTKFGMDQAEADVNLKSIMAEIAEFNLRLHKNAGLPTTGGAPSLLGMAQYGITGGLARAEAVLKAFAGLFAPKSPSASREF